MRNAERETQALANDSQKMEDRLQELKLAMMQEKEQREWVTKAPWSPSSKPTHSHPLNMHAAAVIYQP